jgi:Protein of unknown function (DUF2878)
VARRFALELNSRWAPAVYFVLAQVGWFACVLGAAHDKAYLGVAVVGVLLALHLLRVLRAAAELKLILTVMLLGGAWESALIYLGILAYPHGTGVYGLAPLWLPALWALFAAQVNTAYRWLKPRLLGASLLGLVAGPLSFRAGAALGALRFVDERQSLLWLAVGWACLLPLVILLSRRWDGVAAE